ncbi:hypothetical protein NIES4075_44360 [Tolypothrix sp. NIES-4075]|uniref:hypothetical protein n=1 Tax=Tolypothrix sp. NIES-4075 TaxID=2005459 RepID=UPI000B5CDA52|nr:hypothetical protein [Tolypothrix sp. NIES-4075]GAX43423.1 hypothetical protein NIES4075_44360 [Tolypothrix sp. NIES-4075]
MDWLVDVLGDAFIITPKKKPHNWCGLEIYGCTPKMFNFEAILERLKWIQSQMYQRYELIDKGEEPPLINFVVDEWRLINKNIPKAKEIMKEIITVAREANLRLIAMAQGTQVKTWGFEEESDLEECFSDILIGDFAVERCLSLRRKHHKQSEEYAYWTQVLAFLKQSDRPCMVANQPAIIPDLTNWRRDLTPVVPQDEKLLLASHALGEPLRTIWKFCKERGDWVATRDLLRKDFATLKGVNTDKLKEYFLLLQEKGYGEIDLSGTSAKFKVF